MDASGDPPRVTQRVWRDSPTLLVLFWNRKVAMGRTSYPSRTIPQRWKESGHRHLTQKMAWTVDSHIYRMIFSIIVVLCRVVDVWMLGSSESGTIINNATHNISTPDDRSAGWA